jgi:hypothetical protein
MKRIFFILIAAITITALSAAEKPAEPKIEVKVETSNHKELSQAQKDSVIYEKLNADQLLELKKKELEVKKMEIDADSKEEMPLNGFGIVMIVMLPFLFVATIIYIGARRKSTESKRRYDLYMKSLEMGQTIPENFFEEPKHNVKSSNLKNGIVSLMVGIAFGIYVIIRQDTSLGFLLAALIPGFVGIGYILVHFLEKPAKEAGVKKDEQN